MSNPADPKKPNPNQPDPNAPPSAAPGEHGSTDSLFEFKLPDDVGSFGELPPIPEPDAGFGSRSSTDFALPPPAPTAADGAPLGFSNPGSRGSFGDFGLELPAPEPGESTLGFAPPGVPPLEPPLALESADLLGLSNLSPPVPEVFDLPDLPAEQEMLVEAEELPVADAEIDLADVPPPPDSSSVALDDLADVPVVAPSSFSLGSVVLPVNDLDSFKASIAKRRERESDSVPDVGSLRPAALPAPTDSTPDLPTAAGGHRGGSSFEFKLPDEVNSYSELPPIPEPDEIGSKSDFGTLPPRPTTGPRDASFDFINVSGGRSFAEIGPAGTPVDPTHPAPAAQEPDPSKVGLGNLEAVQPASGWLDGDAAAEPIELTAADLIDGPAEGSDIFAGTPVKPAEPAETSDVLSATSGAPPMADTQRPADVPLPFSERPGDDFSDLPLAEEDAVDSGIGFAHPPATDEESIHDMPAPGSGHSLFDSGTLANSPDQPAYDDAPEYGALPTFTPDASSILADLSAPDIGMDDASSVRVEAPGMNRTLTGGGNDAFELTVPEEPIPSGLFDDANEDTGSDATNWEQQSGSDLLAGRTQAPGDDTVEPVDEDLLGDQPSLSSTASSIFSGAKRPTGSGDSGVADLTDDEFADYLEPDATVSSPSLPEVGPKGKRPAVPNLSSSDFELPTGGDRRAADADDEEVGQIDFDAAEASDPDQRTQGLPPGASLSAILRDGGLPDDSEEMSTRSTQLRGPDPDDETRQPEVSLDYLSESTEGSALALPVQKAPARGKDRSKKSRPPEPEDAPTKALPTKDRAPRRAAVDDSTEEKSLPGKKGSGLLIGALVGALAVGGAFAGIYTTGVIPNGDKAASSAAGPGAQKPGTQPQTNPEPAAPGAFDPRTAFAGGEAAKAVEHYKTNAPATLDEKADAGHVRVFAKAQALPAGGAVAADDPDLQAARASLQEVIGRADAVGQPGGVKRGVRASVALGVSYELTGDLKGARKVYSDAMDRYPSFKSTFEALIDRLDSLEAAAPTGTSRRIAPADAELLLATALLLQEPEPKTDDVEPGVYYWAAVKAANAGNYKLALEQIDKAKEAHLKRSPAFNGRGVNPLSDPREQIFAKSCDELKAYWKLRGAVSGNPDMIAAIQKDGGALAKALDAFTKSSEAVTKAEKEATAAREAAKKLEGDAAKLDKDLKASDKDKVEAQKKLETALADLKASDKKLETATTDLKTAEKDVEAKQAALASLVEVLKPVTPVPDKWTPGDLLAATKMVISRATGPDLKVLVPNAMTAIGGGGLTAGQLVDIAERLNKAEATTKETLAKLVTETQKLKDDHATELQKLTDTYGADIKKLNEGHAEAVKKLKDGGAEELKKLTDKYATDSKKLADEYAAALKTEQDKTEAEKKRAVARELEFQKQLGGAVTPGQVMDLWLPTLTDLRRVSDTGPALDAAKKAIDGSSADSEDGAKARTVAGLAYLIRGDLANAKETFQAARRSPAYKDAAGKPWVLALDNGLEAVTDPAAPFRQPVAVPPVDPKAAAAALDAGIVAYKNGRYADAAKALLNATKNNPSDPIAWYFLGAARWGQGNEEQAQKDFAQGAEREKVATVPNRTTSAALTPIQGATRTALDRVRP